jgi:hypothetical protein
MLVPRAPLGAYLGEVLEMASTVLYGRWGAYHSPPHP